jgi:hypothetical protein
MMLLELLLLAASPAASRLHCPAVSLAVSGSRQFAKAYGGGSSAMRKMSANFAEAYAKACAEGLLSKEPLIYAKSSDRSHLFLVNAPEANMGSIYPSGGRTVFEYWFLTHDGRTHVPSAGQIHEAIYCATVGASAKEHEESGRCLPD